MIRNEARQIRTAVIGSTRRRDRFARRSLAQPRAWKLFASARFNWILSDCQIWMSIASRTDHWRCL